MTQRQSCLIASIDDRYLAFDLEEIRLVIRSVEIIPIPDRPDFLLGVINYKGTIVPVFNIRHKLHLPAQPLRLDDRIILMDLYLTLIGIPVDNVIDIVSSSQVAINTAKTDFLRNDHYIKEIIYWNNQTVLFCLASHMFHDEISQTQSLLDMNKNVEQFFFASH
jgi:chemotaxis signal transduction protein